jgi:tetratricopeptide (TPR) repeat protein
MQASSARAWLWGWLLLLAACGGAATQLPPVSAARPADPRAARIYLEGVEAMGKPDGEPRAIAAFEQALAIDPKLWEAQYNLGVLHRRRGELRKALPHLQAAHELESSAGEPLIALAEAQHALGDKDEAAELLQQYVRAYPDANDVRIALVSVLRERGAYDEALERAREALVREPANVPALLEVGRIYKAKGDLDVAELVFQKVLALDAKHAAAHNDLGLLALTRGDTQRAFDEFDRAVASDPGFSAARMNRASVLLRSGDYASARDEYRKVLEVDGELVDARVGLGICLRGLGQHADAEKEYERALSDSPNHPAALFDLALLRADHLDQHAAARELFQRFLEVAAKDEPQRPMAERYVSELADSQALAADSGKESEEVTP